MALALSLSLLLASAIKPSYHRPFLYHNILGISFSVFHSVILNSVFSNFFFNILVVHWYFLYFFFFFFGIEMGVNSNRVEHVSCLETTVTISSAEVGVMPPPMQIHKVCLPPKLTTLQKLKHRLTEIFFPDDPLYRCKNQTWFNKLIICLQFFFPIFQWGSEYNFSLLKSDVIAGLTIASLAIPQVRLVTIMH